MYCVSLHLSKLKDEKYKKNIALQNNPKVKHILEIVMAHRKICRTTLHKIFKAEVLNSH